MAKGIMGGVTDYSYQSFDDLVTDIEKEIDNILEFKRIIEANLTVLVTNGYWKTFVPFDFKTIVSNCLHFFKTVITELSDISNEIRIEVQEHHCVRLSSLAKVADERNIQFGKIWHEKYLNKEYGNENFDLVENIYQDTRDAVVNLIDLHNIASRLKDFIGRKNVRLEQNKNVVDFSNNTFGDNATIIVGNGNQISNRVGIENSFEDLAVILKELRVPNGDINELKSIIDSDLPNNEGKKFGGKVKEWISRMCDKSSAKIWDIGVDVAGDLLTNAIKKYYDWDF